MSLIAEVCKKKKKKTERNWIDQASMMLNTNNIEHFCLFSVHVKPHILVLCTCCLTLCLCILTARASVAIFVTALNTKAKRV